ncbi:MAG TPA: hypothetical protein ENI90_06665 [Methylothermaceae bacterium]|nr:hypothetical protein [Methylothermaceae bacterium]
MTVKELAILSVRDIDAVTVSCSCGFCLTIPLDMDTGAADACPNCGQLLPAKSLHRLAQAIMEARQRLASSRYSDTDITIEVVKR